MLILTRKLGEIIRIQLAENIDPQTPVAQLFADGYIKLIVTQIQGAQVKLGIAADPRFLDRWFPTRSTSSIPGVVILRDELASREGVER